MKHMLFIFASLFLQDMTGVPNDKVLKLPNEDHLVNIRQLTFGGENAEAYWNHDGTKLIYQTTQPEWEDEQIMIMDADGKNKQLVSTGHGRCTCGYFIPYTDDIVFSSTHWFDTGPAPKADMSKGYAWMVNPHFRIYRKNLKTGHMRMLINRVGYFAETTVSPDGSFMVFTSTMDGDLDIYRADLNGENIVRLTHEFGYDGGPFVSWDGKKIVYRRDSNDSLSATNPDGYLALLKENLVRPSRLEIWVMDADGSNKKQITNLGCASFAPFLHPDGKRVIFSSNYGDPAGREFNLWIINVDGTGLKQITYSKDFDGFPMFSRDGKKLVWASNRNGRVQGETNIFVADWKE